MLRLPSLIALLGLAQVGALRVGPAGIRLSNISTSPCAKEPYTKDLDLVVFGATGYTGKFASHYLAKHAGAVRWAISARSEGKLASLRRELETEAPSEAMPTILAADLSDYNSLLRLAERAKVVISYAGPYEMLGGEALLRACVERCAHYVDITGETQWVVDMMAKYGDTAEAKGLALVPSAGMDSLPADLLVVAAAEAVAADGKGPPSEVSILYTKMNSGGLSGASVMSGSYAESHHEAVNDPYVFVPDAPAEVRVDKEASGPWQRYLTRFNVEPGGYPMAKHDCGIARRSLTEHFPGVGISVSEFISPRAVKAANTKFYMDTRILTDPPKLPIRIGISPPVWMEEKGSFAGEALAVREKDGAAARIQLEGEGSPAYLGTARMSAELALGLVLDGPSRTGFLTPSLALLGGTKALSQRLANSGYFRLQELTPSLPVSSSA